jgi:hypothetical protein
MTIPFFAVPVNPGEGDVVRRRLCLSQISPKPAALRNRTKTLVNGHGKFTRFRREGKRIPAKGEKIFEQSFPGLTGRAAS